MGKIITYIFILFISALFCTDLSGFDAYPAAYLNIPDSIKSIAEEHRFVFYSTGHYGSSWSLVYVDGEKISFLRGRDMGRAIEITEPFENELLAANRSLFSWAIDTMPGQAARLSSVTTPLGIAGSYTVLMVGDPSRGTIFKTENNTSFGGNNQKDFNNKYQRVLFLMNLLSVPELKKYIPESVVYNDITLPRR